MEVTNYSTQARELSANKARRYSWHPAVLLQQNYLFIQTTPSPCTLPSLEVRIRTLTTSVNNFPALVRELQCYFFCSDAHTCPFGYERVFAVRHPHIPRCAIRLQSRSHDGRRPVNFPKKVLTGFTYPGHFTYLRRYFSRCWGLPWELNPQPSDYKSDALPLC